MNGEAARHLTRRAVVAAGALALGVAVVAGVAFARRGGSPGPAAGSASASLGAGLPAPVQPAFVPPAPHRLGRKAAGVWAAVLAPTVARDRPSSAAAPLASLATRAPEGTRNIVLVLGRAHVGGTLWVHVRLPVLPNGTAGWVRRAALGAYVAVRTRLLVELDPLRAVLYRNGRPVFRAPIGVGTDGSPTPRGQFYIRNELTRFASPFYGPIAFGASARSAVHTDWPGGGFIGIHGTNEPNLIPGRVSHGCIRLRNRDIRRLAALMPVGTPLTIR